MKVLYILNHFLPSQTAGTEIYVWSLAKKMKEDGIEIRIVIPNYNQNFSADYMYHGLQVHQFAEPSVVDRSLIMGFKKPEGLLSFKEYIDSEKPDIIHFHELAGSNGITLHHVKEARKSGSKVVMTFHLAGYSCMTGALVENGLSICDGKIDLKKCTKCYLNSKKIKKLNGSILSRVSLFLNLIGINPNRLSNRLGTALGTTALVKKKHNDLIELVANCDKAVVLTKWYKDILNFNGISSEKIVLIPQGLPNNMNFKKGNECKSKKIRFIFVGRISHFKGIHLLVNAFMQLDHTKAELHIFGQTDDYTYESELIQKTSSFLNIQWKGKLEQSDVVATMHDYDALCLCSTFSEMSPLVIQEAFAAKIPVIASNVYGNAEQIMDNVNSLLFNFNDADDLLKQLERCVNEPDLLPRLASNILPPSSFDTVSKKHLEVYKELLYSN